MSGNENYIQVRYNSDGFNRYEFEKLIPKDSIEIEYDKYDNIILSGDIISDLGPLMASYSICKVHHKPKISLICRDYTFELRDKCDWYRAKRALRGKMYSYV